MAAPTAGKAAGYRGLFHSGGAAILAEIAAILAAERGKTITGWVRTLLRNQVLGHDLSCSDEKTMAGGDPASTEIRAVLSHPGLALP
jgi:hypothetical protein